MTESNLYKLRFPIGEFKKPEVITKQHIKEWIASIEALPQSIISITKDLSEKELNYKYRPNGWTIKQVVHHCADSHINSLIRFKLALTEHTPTIRPYFEDRFAELKDYSEPINASISILIGVHKKLGILLKNLNKDDLNANLFILNMVSIFLLKKPLVFTLGIAIIIWDILNKL